MKAGRQGRLLYFVGVGVGLHWLDTYAMSFKRVVDWATRQRSSHCSLKMMITFTNSSSQKKMRRCAFKRGGKARDPAAC